MSSKFGRKKPAVRQSGQAQGLAWLPRPKASDGQHPAAHEMQQALYRITNTRPSRLERARIVRGRMKLSA
jgi:hypothetical protein